MTSLVFIVGPGEEGRIDSFLATHFPEASRKRLSKLFTDGAVRLDGSRVKKGTFIHEGQQIKLANAPATDEDFRVLPEPDENRCLNVVHEDDEIVVLNKEAGMATYPLRAKEVGTAANLLVRQFPECTTVGDDPREAGLTHRLDQNTSGLLIAARNQQAWLALRRQFADGNVQKSYFAVVHRRPVSKECEEPLLQHGKRVCIDYAGLDAHTSWTELSRTPDFTLLRCVAHTGRMHQVRAHLAACDSPIAGDILYGGVKQPALIGHFLHAASLVFTHPTAGTTLTLSAPLPQARMTWLTEIGLTLLPDSPAV